jgi:peroxiredoxin
VHLPNTFIEVGDPAPDFVLKDQYDHEVHLSDFRGKQVVLGFHPNAWTGVCTLQMQDLEAKRVQMDGMGAIAFGISVDSVPCKRAWAQAIKVEGTSLLADFWPHGGVADSFGVFVDKFGISERAVFIIDELGVVTWKKVYPNKQRPDIMEILENLEEDSA